MMRALVAASLAAVLSLLPNRSAAQPELRPYAAVGIEEGYDSNVLNGGEADAVSRVLPRVGVIVPGRRLELGVDYRAALHAYVLRTADTTLNHRAAVHLDDQITRQVALAVGAVYIHAQDPTLLERPGVLLPKGTIDDLGATARLSGRITRRLTLDAAYAYRVTRFANAPLDTTAFATSDAHELGVGGDYRVTRRLGTRLYGRVQRFDAAGESAEDALAAGVGLSFRATRELRLGLDGAPVVFVEASHVTWLAAARAVYERRRDRVRLTILRDIYGGTGLGAALWAEVLRLEYVRRVTRAMDLRLTGWIGQSGMEPGGATEFQTGVGHGELRWRLRRNLAISWYAEYRGQHTVGTGDNLQRTIAGVRLLAAAGVDTDTLTEMP